jgi:hypothetical protein
MSDVTPKVVFNVGYFPIENGVKRAQVMVDLPLVVIDHFDKIRNNPLDTWTNHGSVRWSRSIEDVSWEGLKLEVQALITYTTEHLSDVWDMEDDTPSPETFTYELRR